MKRPLKKAIEEGSLESFLRNPKAIIPETSIKSKR
tara:strand:- start:1663 stop:1767 length:105 start_codon:yes stop_codon:yes gene_type:complete